MERSAGTWPDGSSQGLPGYPSRLSFSMKAEEASCYQVSSRPERSVVKTPPPPVFRMPRLAAKAFERIEGFSIEGDDETVASPALFRSRVSPLPLSFAQGPVERGSRPQSSRRSDGSQPSSLTSAQVRSCQGRGPSCLGRGRSSGTVLCSLIGGSPKRPSGKRRAAFVMVLPLVRRGN